MDPASGEFLKNKGPEPRSTLTSNGRISIVRRRFQLAGGGGLMPADALLDLAEATLSFLGIGVPPDVASWGGMLNGAAQTYVQLAPWLGVFPGLAIALVVFAWNLLGDALRDVLDPRLRGLG